MDKNYHTPLYWLLSLLLCGCASSAKYNESEINTPTNWQSIEFDSERYTDWVLKSRESDWLNYFKENETLQSLIKSALLGNQDIAIAASRVALAQAELKSINANRLPFVNGSLNNNRQKINSFGPTSINNAITYENYVGSLGLRWEIDLWGSLRNQTKANLAILESNEATLQFAKMSIASQIVKTWLSIMHTSGQLQLLEKHLELQSFFLKSTEERYIKGLIFTEALLTEKSKTEKLKESFNQLNLEKDKLKRSLSVLTGNYPLSESLIYSPLPEIISPIPAGIPSEILNHRPDIRAMERQLASSNERLVSIRKEVFPKLSLTGNSGYASTELSSLLKNQNAVWSVATSMAQPLINFGSIKAKIKASEANHEENRAQYKKVILNAFKEVENALSNESYYLDLKKSSNLILCQNHRIADITKSKYINGNAEFLDFLNAQIRLLKSKQENLKIQHDHLQNRINLHLALGYSFNERPQLIVSVL